MKLSTKSIAMKYYSLIPILLAASQLAVSQDSILSRKLVYRITVTQPSLIVVTGYLANLSDTSVQVTKRKTLFARSAGILPPTTDIAYAQISELTLKRTGGAGRGAWKGAVAGILIGAVTGFIAGDDPPCQSYNASTDYWGFATIGNGLCNAFRMTAGEKALVGGVFGGAVGAGAGALVGALLRKKVVIGGNKENFDAMKSNVLNKAYGSKTSPANSNR